MAPFKKLGGRDGGAFIHNIWKCRANLLCKNE